MDLTDINRWLSTHETIEQELQRWCADFQAKVPARCNYILSFIVGLRQTIQHRKCIWTTDCYKNPTVNWWNQLYNILNWVIKQDCISEFDKNVLITRFKDILITIQTYATKLSEIRTNVRDYKENVSSRATGLLAVPIDGAIKQLDSMFGKDLRYLTIVKAENLNQLRIYIGGLIKPVALPSPFSLLLPFSDPSAGGGSGVGPPAGGGAARPRVGPPPGSGPSVRSGVRPPSWSVGPPPPK